MALAFDRLTRGAAVPTPHAPDPVTNDPAHRRPAPLPRRPHTLPGGAPATPVIQVEHLRKCYGGTVAVDDVSLEVEPRRDLRHPRPQRRRQDDHGRDHRRPAHPRRRHGPRPRPRPASRPRAAARDGRPAAPGERSCRPKLTRARGARPVRVVLRRTRPTRRRCSTTLGLDRPGGRRVRAAVRRPEAAAVGRARARRQPAGRDPRRADHRPRPARPPRHVGGRRGDPGARRDDRAGHAPHGGGRAALRPDRAHRRRAGGRDRARRRELVGAGDGEQVLRLRPVGARAGAGSSTVSASAVGAERGRRRSRCAAAATSCRTCSSRSTATTSGPSSLRLEQRSLEDAFVALTTARPARREV